MEEERRAASRWRFQVDFIDAAGNFKAGCHDFSFDEIARLAALLNLSEIPAGDTTNHA